MQRFEIGDCVTLIVGRLARQRWGVVERVQYGGFHTRLIVRLDPSLPDLTDRYTIKKTGDKRLASWDAGSVEKRDG